MVITLILPECPKKSSWNFVCTSCHTSKISLINNTNTAAFQIVFSYRVHYTYILRTSFFLYQILKLKWKENRSLALPRNFCNVILPPTHNQYFSSHMTYDNTKMRLSISRTCMSVRVFILVCMHKLCSVIPQISLWLLHTCNCFNAYMHQSSQTNLTD